MKEKTDMQSDIIGSISSRQIDIAIGILTLVGALFSQQFAINKGIPNFFHKLPLTSHVSHSF
jgi:hypothetical protein